MPLCNFEMYLSFKERVYKMKLNGCHCLKVKPTRSNKNLNIRVQPRLVMLLRSFVGYGELEVFGMFLVFGRVRRGSTLVRRRTS